MKAWTVAAAFALTAAAPTMSSAQASGRDEPVAPFSAIYLATGTLLVDVTKLNPHFERTDLPVNSRPGFFTISNDAYAVGLGAYGTVFNRMVIGAEYTSADLGEEASPSGKTNRLATTYVLGTVGYALVTTWRLNVVPFVGFGPGKLTLTLKSRDGGASVPAGQSPTIDEIILSPGSKSTVTGTYFMVQPGLAADFLILKESASTMGVTLGIRFASALSPNRTTWKYEGGQVFGGPDVGPTGGVLRVVAGIGGFRLGGAAR